MDVRRMHRSRGGTTNSSPSDGSLSETEEDLERERQKLMKEMEKVRREMKREEIRQLKAKLEREKQGMQMIDGCHQTKDISIWYQHA